MKNLLSKNNLLTFIAVIVLTSGIYFGVLKSYESSKWAFITAIVLFLIANLARFRRLRVDKSGIEAETREVVEEAKSTIKELRDLSKIMASISLGLLKRTGRFGGGYSYEEKEGLKDSVVKVLRQIGVSDEECEKIVTESKWHRYVEFDYVHHILGGGKTPNALPEERLAEWMSLRNRGLDNIATPKELTQFLDQCGLLNDEVKELIEDYEHYIRFRKQRRPSIWKDRGNWFRFLK